MDELISRQAAISLPVKPREDRYFQTQSLDDAYDYGWRSLQRCIEKLPSAQTEQHWIPVAERLPNDDTEVIVSCTDDSGDGKFSYGTTGWHFKGMWIVNNERCFFVRAWQPLPEKPYREEEA